jgi:hypothetical protein
MPDAWPSQTIRPTRVRRPARRTWRKGARRALIPTALVVAAALGAAVSLLLNSQPPGASWTGWLNAGLEDYAATAGQWNSGDNAVQVALPGNRALWLFNDSYYGPVHADGTIRPDTPLVHNMLLLTSGSGVKFRVTNTITGPVSNGVPAPAVPPVIGAPPGSWAWPSGGIVAGDAVQAIYSVFAPYGPGPLDYVPVGNQVVTMPLASLTQPSSYVIQPSGFDPASLTAGCGIGGTGCVQWGVGLLNATSCPQSLATCTYIYGEMWAAPGDGRRTLVVAVAPQGALADISSWWYDTVSGWSRSPTGLATPVGRDTRFTAGSVYRLAEDNADDNYVVLGSGPAGGIIAYYARTPGLAGARPARLFSAPASRGVPGFYAYQAHIYPAYSRGTSVVIGFSVNSFDHDRNCLNYAPYYDVSAYQPEFYSVTLPSSASAATGPQTLPPPRLHQFLRPSPGGPWQGGACQNP